MQSLPRLFDDFKHKELKRPISDVHKPMSPAHLVHKNVFCFGGAFLTIDSHLPLAIQDDVDFRVSPVNVKPNERSDIKLCVDDELQLRVKVVYA
ncbi:MAG: hypothetical protein AAF125_13760 [Chloroflexota bacterium]